MFPNGQWPVNMYTKLNVTFKEETIVSAMLKFTAKEKINKLVMQN